MIPQSQSSQTPSRKGQFTGWHATMIFVAFFGVVIAVNLVMARDAITTFGGLVVENSYVASQHFNQWLAEADAERALGWKATMERSGPETFQTQVLDSNGKPIAAADVRLFAEHPLGQRPPIDITLTESAPGLYSGPLPAGRWYTRLIVIADGRTWRKAGEVR
ncbi:MAG: FixH family protein [Sphingomonadales bacterium]|nr:FixH family protein [Sphingomonadales bacterium]MDE2567275.1 FixH family protein [Sphingomonadales bacterium]